jgi:LacI family transcriptional regulator
LTKIPSIRTVAERAGVSTATVSNVLNHRRNVAPALAERVRTAVAELGYIADLGAARLRSRRSTVAGVLVPDIANPFFGTLVSILEEEAREAGYDLLIASSGGVLQTEEARLRALLTWRPAGLIVVPCETGFPAAALAISAGVPMVAADRIPAGIEIDCVMVDNAGTSAAVGRHLAQAGFRHILVLATSLEIGNMVERSEGARSGAGPEVRVEVLEAGIGVPEAREILLLRLAEADRPDAIFTLDNWATLGALEALQKVGLRVGTDIALLGFDQEEWMRVVSPPLSAVRQPIEAMARTAWELLLARIGGDVSPPKLIQLDCALDVRASSLRRIEAGGEPVELG